MYIKKKKCPHWSFAGCFDFDYLIIASYISQLQASSSQAPVPTALKNFSMSQKDKALQEFVQDQWLCDTADGKIGLGVRSFLDLRSWFHNNEVPPCDVCNEAGIKVLSSLFIF